MLKNLIKSEAASGVVMIIAAAIALLLTNSAFFESYKNIIEYKIFQLSLKEAVKDILMPIFFFVIGLELKKEMKEGFLSQKGQKILPFVAALGGIITPALIYLALNHQYPENRAGWAIPSATDIAFALCAMSLIGRSVPASAKIFLLAIAIYDDLAAVVIIALFYTGGLDMAYIAAAAVIVAGLFIANRKGVFNIYLYIVAGVALWVCFHNSGIHGTVAGVIMGAMVPLKHKGRATLSHILHSVQPYSAFAILPLFAFVSSGINFQGITAENLFNPLTTGIAAALFFGKQFGIFLFTYLAVKFRLAARPQGASWVDIYAVAIIAGVGFTMSLFIGLLAFPSEFMQQEVKTGVIIGSLLSVLWGWVVIKLFRKA